MKEPAVVTVFCASSTQISKIYIEAAESLAQHLVDEGYAIKYGGGAVGLMGALANKVLSLNGKIHGVIPKFMVEVEWQHPHVQSMLVTETMHQRKQALVQNVSAVVALPGSSGTLEELAEVISMKKLGLFSKPIIIVNTNNFYDPFVQLMEKMANENFMKHEHLRAFSVVNDPREVCNIIASSPEWPIDAPVNAAV
ncbi:MAG: TIGR00730 family Rossman fold protein [Breznakibacter sp.]